MTTPQGDSPPVDHSDAEPVDHADVDEHTDTADDQGDGQPDAGDRDGQRGDGDQSNREKRYRLKLRETEAQRDALQAQVGALRSRVLDNAVREAGYKPDLAELLDTDALFDADSGMLDSEKASATINDTAAKYGIRRLNPLAENPQQGMRSPPPRPEASWSQLIGDAARRGHG